MNIEGVKIDYSKGYCKNGKIAAFVRPANKCTNRSRRITAYSSSELNEKILKCIEKYFTPVNYYKIDGFTIGSNTEENALREYWRVCHIEDYNKLFEVKNITQPQYE